MHRGFCIEIFLFVEVFVNEYIEMNIVFRANIVWGPTRWMINVMAIFICDLLLEIGLNLGYAFTG